MMPTSTKVQIPPLQLKVANQDPLPEVEEKGIMLDRRMISEEVPTLRWEGSSKVAVHTLLHQGQAMDSQYITPVKREQLMGQAQLLQPWESHRATGNSLL